MFCCGPFGPLSCFLDLFMRDPIGFFPDFRVSSLLERSSCSSALGQSLDPFPLETIWSFSFFSPGIFDSVMQG